MFSRQLQRCRGKKKQNRNSSTLHPCIYSEKRPVFPSLLHGSLSMWPVTRWRCAGWPSTPGEGRRCRGCVTLWAGAQLSRSLRGAHRGLSLPAATDCGSSFTLKGRLSWRVLSPLQPRWTGLPRRGGAGPAGLGCPRDEPGCSCTGGVGTEGAGSSQWDAAQCCWRGFQPARSCPGILERRAPFGRVFCPDLSAAHSPEGSDPWGGTKARPRPPQRCWALTLPASACYLFLPLSLSPLAFSPLPLSCRMVSVLLGWVAAVSQPPQQSLPLSQAQLCRQQPVPGHGKGKARKEAREKMVQKRQNTEMVPGDFNIFCFFCPL